MASSTASLVAWLYFAPRDRLKSKGKRVLVRSESILEKKINPKMCKKSHLLYNGFCAGVVLVLFDDPAECFQNVA